MHRRRSLDTLVLRAVSEGTGDVMLVHPKVSAETAAELIAFARANPGKPNYSPQGNGAAAR